MWPRPITEERAIIEARHTVTAISHLIMPVKAIWAAGSDTPIADIDITMVTCIKAADIVLLRENIDISAADINTMAGGTGVEATEAAITGDERDNCGLNGKFAGIALSGED